MSLNIKGILKGALFSLVITFFLIFILSLAAYFTNISEGTITIAAYASVVAGALIGSALAARAAENKKFLHVMLMCAVYTVCLTAASAAVNGKIMFNAHTAAIIGGIFAASFLGLVIGNKNG